MNDILWRAQKHMSVSADAKTRVQKCIFAFHYKYKYYLQAQKITSNVVRRGYGCFIFIYDCGQMELA